MPALNHTIIYVRDKDASAMFLAGILAYLLLATKNDLSMLLASARRFASHSGADKSC